MCGIIASNMHFFLFYHFHEVNVVTTVASLSTKINSIRIVQFNAKYTQHLHLFSSLSSMGKKRHRFLMKMRKNEKKKKSNSFESEVRKRSLANAPSYSNITNRSSILSDNYEASTNDDQDFFNTTAKEMETSCCAFSHFVLGHPSSFYGTSVFHSCFTFSHRRWCRPVVSERTLNGKATRRAPAQQQKSAAKLTTYVLQLKSDYRSFVRTSWILSFSFVFEAMKKFTSRKFRAKIQPV